MVEQPPYLRPRSIEERFRALNLSDDVLFWYLRNGMDIGMELASERYQRRFRGYLRQKLVCKLIETFCSLWVDLDGHNWVRLPRSPVSSSRSMTTHHILEKLDRMGLFGTEDMQNP